MPEMKFGSKAEIPEEFHGEVKEVDGKFVINLSLTSKVDEFRNTNIAVRQERDGLKQKLAPFEALGIEDPVKFKDELPQLRQTAQLVADGKLTGTDKIETEVQKRVGQANKDTKDRLTALETQNAQLKGRADGWESKYRDLHLTQQITEAARAKDSPVNPDAVADIVTRARGAGWSADENGNLVAKRNGQPVYSQKDPAKELGLQEWLGDVVKSAPYLGKPSVGGGAAGGAGKQGQEYFQSEAFQKLPPAERMAKAREAEGGR